MLTNYLKIAWRNLLKNKTFSLINIAGLAAGLACFILIALYVADELSYDRFHKKADRIYRINSDILFGGNNLHMAVTPDPMGAALKNEYPQVEEFVRLYNSGGYRMVKKGNSYIREDRILNADSTIFDVFTLPVVSGETNRALTEPNTVVISATAAKKYFGSTDVIGKNIETDENNSTLYKIMAVIKDLPEHSHFNVDFIFSMKNVNYPWGTFLSHNFQTYIVLKEGTDYRAFEKNFPPFVEKHVLPEAKQFMNIHSMEEFTKAGNKLEYSLIPLRDIHLHSDRSPELGVNGNIQYVYIFSAVALFVLLLACINFMNLSTARSAGRAKEVGIRKVLGSEKKSLIYQFLTESTLMAFISLVFALLITWAALGYFNGLSGKNITMFSLLRPGYLTFLLLLPLLVGLLAGVYPAFYLSAFQPVKVLKGAFHTGFKRSNLRNVLVVFQFATSIILIVGTIIVYRQLNFIQTKKLGFNKDQVLVVNGTGALGNNATAFKEEVGKIAGVSGASFAGYLPVSNSSRNDNSYSKESVMDATNSLNMQTWVVDEDYLDVMGMELLSGRNFSKELSTDTSSMIINETTAKFLGYENPLGKKVYTFFQDQFSTRLVAYNIIGVVKNFHFESLKSNIGPLCFRMGKASWVTAFKVKSGDINNLVNNVEKKWKAMAPAMPFSYQFLDESFDNMYRVEQRTGKLGFSLALIAILIACLGLFGLATYMAEQRIKEIGVRKVLGASIGNITSLLSKDFIRLVLIAAVIAFPVAWWAMHQWLKDFAYRVDIPWWVFVMAGIISILIAVLTVSSQAIKAAVANPVKSLRTE